MFLLNERLVNQVEIRYEVGQKAIYIVAFEGVVASSGGTRYSHLIVLEIGNGHRSTISAEIPAAGYYDLLIPFRWLYKEYPVSNLEDVGKWEFKHDGCHAHVEDEAVTDLYKEHETVAYDPQAQYIGRIGYEKGEKEITLDRLLRGYLWCKKLFLQETAEKIPPPKTFDELINLKE